MSFSDGWPRCDKILARILCLSILSLAYCDLFAALHILLQRCVALVSLDSSRAHRSGLGLVAAVCWAVSILYFLMISLTWPRGPISWTAATSQRAAAWRCLCSRGGKVCQGIGPSRLFGLATQTLASERLGACRCESSSGPFPISNKLNSKLVSLNLTKDGATVIRSCVGRHQTIPYMWSAAKKNRAVKDAADAEVESTCKKYSRNQMMQPRYTVKRYSELPKTITLAKHCIFSWSFANRSVSLCKGSVCKKFSVQKFLCV